ncbi:MAG: TolC family protein [Campylobacterales bacterium]|nr:TolC family protein [Campylobacterales bacterium]
MKRYLLFLIALPLFAGMEHLSLQQALDMLKKDNLELKIAKFEEQMKMYEAKAAKGHNFGSLDVTVTGMRSNDAGNVFGFKLQSREADFGDFGFSDFLACQSPTPPSYCTDGTLLNKQPGDLNYPEARNHYVTKLSYVLPIYTGGKLTEYGHITDSLYKMSQYDTQKLLNEKIFQTKKAFYDISLVENYITNLSKIMQNINRLESVVKSMKKEGYAQNIDVLEVQARKAEADSMLNQAKLNRELAYQFLSFLLNTEVSSIQKVDEMAPMPQMNKEELMANSIDIQKALLGLQISEMAVNVEKANFLPTIGAFAEYGSADNVLWNEFMDKDAYTFGIQFKWNIFNGGIDAANLERAKVNYLKVHDQVDLAKNGIALQVKKLQTEVLSKSADIDNYKKQLIFAKKVYENYHERYKEGLVSISDLLIKQSKELEMLLKLLTVENERNTKIFELNSILNNGGNV